MTTNVFDVIIGRGTLKWDAAWRVIGWLADPEEDHGLGGSFREHLAQYCFGHVAASQLKIEYYLGNDSVGKQKWPDIALAAPTLDKPQYLALIDDLADLRANDSRKISNLVTYAQLGRDKFPGTQVCVVAITDTTSVDRFNKLREAFAAQNLEECRLLPLQTIATWIDGDASLPVVRSFKEWAQSL